MSDKKQHSAKKFRIDWSIMGSAFLGMLLAFLAAWELAPSKKERIETDKDRILALAKTHPDPFVRRNFVKAVQEQRLVLRIEETPSHGYADFSVQAGMPMIRVDPQIIPMLGTAPGRQLALGVLAHEGVHYAQWLDGSAQELHQSFSARKPLSEAQCVQVVAVEVEAYAAGCREAHEYDWKASLYQCDQTDRAWNASQSLKNLAERMPECVEIWKTLAGMNAPPPPAPRSPDPVSQPTAPMVQSTVEAPPPVKTAAFLSPP